MEKQTLNDIIQKLRAGELDNPDELSNFLVILSAGLFEVSESETEAEIEYLKRWEQIKTSEDKITDKLAEAKAKQTDEYRLFKKMKNTRETLLETIRALKKKLANMADEFRSGQNY